MWDEHTESGAHASREMAFPEWVPTDVMKQAEALSAADAEQVLSTLFVVQPVKTQRQRRTKGEEL